MVLVRDIFYIHYPKNKENLKQHVQILFILFNQAKA